MYYNSRGISMYTDEHQDAMTESAPFRALSIRLVDILLVFIGLAFNLDALDLHFDGFAPLLVALELYFGEGRNIVLGI